MLTGFGSHVRYRFLAYGSAVSRYATHAVMSPHYVTGSQNHTHTHIYVCTIKHTNLRSLPVRQMNAFQSWTYALFLCDSFVCDKHEAKPATSTYSISVTQTHSSTRIYKYLVK